MPPVAELTPMLRHYLELKGRHPDCFLFYRMGDFFELFFDDAIEVAKLLGLTLTARQKGTESEAPMCGVPHHAAMGYAGKLLAMGRKVAICDQVEDPATAKGLVKREITRVLTPGTLAESGLLDARQENLLAVLLLESERWVGAFLDASTGQFFVRRFRDLDEAVAELEASGVRELLVERTALPAAIAAWASRSGACLTDAGDRFEGARAAADRLKRRLGVGTLRGVGLDDDEPAVRAAAAALAYAEENQLTTLEHVRDLAVRETRDRLVLDATTLANLEVLRNTRDGGVAGSLLELVDRTRSAAGARRVRDWLRRPLVDPVEIAARHDAVAALVADPVRATRLSDLLDRIPDFERLAARAVIGTLGPREAAALRDGLAVVPAIAAEIALSPSRMLAAAAQVDPLAALAAELERMLAPSPSPSLEEGGVIAHGVEPELDLARSLARDSKSHVLAIEVRERERTGISSLKIRYNRVFGYSIEISRANAAKVPPDYQRRQTLVNAERYSTPELQELEGRIVDAESRQLELERTLFTALRAGIARSAAGLGELAQALATVDVVAGWARLAIERRYVRPELHSAGAPIRIVDGRHPVVERSVGDAFVANDVDLDPAASQIVLLTGPNMGGKSTYLRQVALTVLLAQAGSFVPAASASIGVVDRIFSRVGASDDLARGESTFMVEMVETANILRFATRSSLVILDEVGRGTATFDGLSLAWAIVEHLHEKVGAMTLFATHYHELTELAELLPRVVNRTMAVREWQERIVFLRRVVPGSADKSYGLHVARLAGVPEPVVARAEQVLANLEAKEYDPTGRPRLAEGAEFVAERPGQMPLFTPTEELVAQIVREVDLERLTPLAALNLIASLQDRLK